jgi:2-polyprenyl-3-methyl-5-hydroxy-6-metoxy-1,4-benzoquinol methylase
MRRSEFRSDPPNAETGENWVRAWLLEYLVCLECTERLRSVPEIEADEDLETGTLRCERCGATYPVVRGIPRMSGTTVDRGKQRTADAFGWQWQEFEHVYQNQTSLEAEFLDWIAPLDSAFFKDKVVLDAGCGMGRFSVAAAGLGAERVIGVDLSESVEAAHHFSRHLNSVAIVQADLYHLPFRNPFDFAFSIGVIHHLPDPKSGIASIGKHVKPGGSLFAWVYGRENNGWIVNAVNPIREHFTSRLPRRGLQALSLAITAVVQPTLRLYRPRQRHGLGRFLPYYAYMYWLSKYGFRHNLVVIFDHLVAPTAFYVRREEFRAWFEQAGFPRIDISARNDNSWRGHGWRRDDVTEEPSNR